MRFEAKHRMSRGPHFVRLSTKWKIFITKYTCATLEGSSDRGRNSPWRSLCIPLKITTKFRQFSVASYILCCTLCTLCVGWCFGGSPSNPIFFKWRQNPPSPRCKNSLRCTFGPDFETLSGLHVGENQSSEMTTAWLCFHQLRLVNNTTDFHVWSFQLFSPIMCDFRTKLNQFAYKKTFSNSGRQKQLWGLYVWLSKAEPLGNFAFGEGQLIWKDCTKMWSYLRASQWDLSKDCWGSQQANPDWTGVSGVSLHVSPVFRNTQILPENANYHMPCPFFNIFSKIESRGRASITYAGRRVFAALS